MRAGASVGVLSEGPDGKFSETPMSRVLRSDANPSLRAFATMTGRDWHGRGWSHLEYCVRTGKRALDRIYGTHIFEYLKQNPAEGKIFNDAMTELSMIDGPAVADAYNFEGIRSVVDTPVATDFCWQPSWRKIRICAERSMKRPTLWKEPRTDR
jgi:O-methyltransferase